MASRRERRLQRQRKVRREGKREEQQEEQRTPERKSLFDTIFYDNYKKLLIIPFLLLLLALLQIGVQYATTGDFLHKGVSLSGGITMTVPVNNETITVDEVQSLLEKAFPNREFIVRGLSELSQLRGIVIEMALKTDNESAVKAIEGELLSTLEPQLPNIRRDYSIEVIGPSLGASFFHQTMMAVALAFILMGLVVFLYFGDSTKAKITATIISLIAYVLFTSTTSLPFLIILVCLSLVILYTLHSPPSAAVILAAFSDIVVTLAVVNLLGVKISSAGVAAFLMLIGYSVDTDILLSTRVLKQRRGTIYESIKSSMRTGVLMSLTSFAAAVVGFLISQSATIKQIMLIILIGLLADIINTWLQNAGIIRLYAEKREAAR